MMTAGIIVEIVTNIINYTRARPSGLLEIRIKEVLCWRTEKELQR